MSKKDLNDIAAIEQAIAKKYGKEAIKNPRADWDVPYTSALPRTMSGKKK